MSENRSIPYSEKLKDPRWQKKRLEILERDRWECHLCAEREKTLHVHHLFYFSKREPWEINNGFLITLCENCHSAKTDGDILCAADIIQTEIGDLLNEIWKKRITGEVGLLPLLNAFQKYKPPKGFPLDFKISASVWKWEPKKNG